MSYYNVDEVITVCASLVAHYPARARMIDLPYQSAEGRMSKAVHLSSAIGGVGAKDTLLITAGVHGAEWGSCEIAINLALDLLSAYELGSGLGYGGKSFSAAEVHGLLAMRDIVILPLVNPDGRHCSQTVLGRSQWRKNRNPAFANGDLERIGVDINRNFDFLFDLTAFAPSSGVSASNDPARPDYYQGPSACSEPETRNVAWLLDQFPLTRWFIDLHSTGETIHYVWSDDDSQQSTPAMNFRNPAFDGLRGQPGSNYKEFLASKDLANAQKLAQRFVADLQAVAGTHYRAGPAYEFTPYSGTSHDYAYARHLYDSSKSKALGFVVEWGSLDCQPAWTDMESIIKEVTAGLIGFGLATL